MRTMRASVPSVASISVASSISKKQTRASSWLKAGRIRMIAIHDATSMPQAV